MDPRSIIIRPVISEKTYALIAAGKYTFRVDDRSNKYEIKNAVEVAFGVEVVKDPTSHVRSKPKSRGLHTGKSRAWKKAIFGLARGDSIERFEGAAAEG